MSLMMRRFCLALELHSARTTLVDLPFSLFRSSTRVKLVVSITGSVESLVEYPKRSVPSSGKLGVYFHGLKVENPEEKNNKVSSPVVAAGSRLILLLCAVESRPEIPSLFSASSCKAWRRQSSFDRIALYLLFLLISPLSFLEGEGGEDEGFPRTDNLRPILYLNLKFIYTMLI